VTYTAKDLTKASKFMSYVLRHGAAEVGVTMSADGWVALDDLIQQSQNHTPLTEDLVHEVVATNEKRRFALSDDGRSIRASQGHSIRIDLGLSPETPPPVLYHGTSEKSVASIRQEGLVPGDRNHVHLSSDINTAIVVGRRHGRPVVLEVAADAMHTDGHQFYLSENKVWLTDAVPPAYLAFPD
jgi:putative RNA 2'-phosphotransferase